MIRVRIFNARRHYRLDPGIVRGTARRVFRGEKRTDVECNIVFIHDDQMIELNGLHLRHWFTTDVLTFPLHEPGEMTLTGEVYINVDQARRQALDYKISIKNELLRLTIHGALHLVGYRDASKRQKADMTILENHYLRPK